MTLTSSRRLTVLHLSVTSGWKFDTRIGYSGSHNLASRGRYVPIPLFMISDIFNLSQFTLERDLNACISAIQAALLCLTFTPAN